MYRLLDRAAGVLAHAMAYLGGALLIGLTIVTCYSIICREIADTFGIGPGPIRGIYDITQIVVAAACFAFLPWCQYARGHASVDLLTSLFGSLANRLIDLIADLGFLLVAIVGFWRMYVGMTEKSEWEVTFILQFPLKQAYIYSLIGLGAFVLIAAFCVLRSTRGMFVEEGQAA